MRTVNIHKAKTHLSKLVDAAAKGEPFIIAKAGKPMVMVTANRILITQAMCEGLTLLTADAIVAQYSGRILKV